MTTKLVEGDTKCVCEATYYADSLGNCTVCSEDLVCDKEGATIESMDLVGGAWRAHKGSDDVYSCPVEGTCVGGNDTNLYCANGTGGVLCASCLKGWFRRGSSDACQTCPDDPREAIGWVAAIATLGTLFVGSFIALDLKYGWSRKNGGGRLKPMVNTIQQLTVMVMYPAKWPTQVKELGKYFEFLSVDVSIASPVCFGIPFNYYSRFKASAVIAWFLILVPMVAALAVSVVFAAFPCVCRGKSLPHKVQGFQLRFNAMWRRARARGMQYSMIVILFVHPAVSGQAFYFFSCHAIMDNVENPTVPTYYMVADYSITCFDDGWYELLPLATFQVVGFAIGMPALFLFLLIRHREEIKQVVRRDIADALADNNKKKVTSTAGGGTFRKRLGARTRSMRNSLRRIVSWRQRHGSDEGAVGGEAKDGGETKEGDPFTSHENPMFERSARARNVGGSRRTSAMYGEEDEDEGREDNRNGEGKGHEDDDGGGETKGDALLHVISVASTPTGTTEAADAAEAAGTTEADDIPSSLSVPPHGRCDVNGDGIIGPDEAAQKITIRNAFAKYDRDGSGAIDAEELGNLIAELTDDAPLTLGELEEAVAMLDTDGDGTVDLREFTDWWLFRGDAGSSGKKASALQKKL